MARNLITVAVLCSVTAWAQDGGIPSRATAPFSAEKVVGSLVPSGSSRTVEPVWVDSQRRVIAEPTSGPLVFGCFSTTTSVLQPLPSPFLLNPQAPGTPNEALGARPGSDVFTVANFDGNFNVRVYRASCETTSQYLGTFAPPSGLEPPMRAVHPIDASGAMFYLLPSGLVRLGLTPVLSASLVTPMEDIRAAVGVAPADGGNDDGAFRVSGLTVTPADALFFHVSHTTPTQSPALYNQPVWLVRRAPSGALSVVWSTVGAGGSVSAAWDSVSGNVFLDGLSSAIGPALLQRLVAVVPALPPAVLATQPRSFPSRPNFFPGGSLNMTPEPLVRLVGGSSSAYAMTDQNLYSVTVDPALADFDRDGLRAAHEARLGTSDYAADTDEDGLPDGWELAITRTSPLDAGSGVAPAVVDDALLLGPSFSAQLWTRKPASTEQSWGPLMCLQGACWGPDFQTLPNGSSVVGSWQAPFPPAGQAAMVVHHRDAQGARSLNLSTGASTAFSLPTVVNFAQVPIDATTALVLQNDSFLGSVLWRVSSAGVPPFAVIDVTRLGCEILSDPAELLRCGVDPELSTPDIAFIDFVGFDPDLRMVLVRVKTHDAQFVLGIDATRVVRLADFTTTAFGFDVKGLVPMSLAGSSGYLALTMSPTAVQAATVRLDGVFRRVDSAQPFVDTDTLARRPFFRRGFTEASVSSYLFEGAAGMISGRLHSWPVEWVPVPAALEQGEVLSWSRLRFRAGPVLARDPLLGSYGPPSQMDTWNLWRTTALGATVEWLRGPQFLAHLSPSDRALVAVTPLGDVTAMGISSDGLKICLSEGAERRTWELELDPATRRLSDVHLASSSMGAGCAYDEQGTLATLGKGPTVIQLGARTIPVPSVFAPIGLYRLGGRFVVQADHADSACVTDDGAVKELAAQLIAISAAPGGMAWLEADSLGQDDAFTDTVERFCAQQPPAERLVGPSGLYEGLYSPRFTTRTVRAYSAVLAVRADGMVLTSMSSLRVPGTGRPDNVQTIPNALFFLFPTYEPTNASGSSPLPEHDAFRIEAPVHGVAATLPYAIIAMAVVPGGAASRDWGYPERPGTRTVAPPADAGQQPPSEPPSEPPQVEPGPTPGCGCGSTSASLGALALLLAGQRRRRTALTARCHR